MNQFVGFYNRAFLVVSLLSLSFTSALSQLPDYTVTENWNSGVVVIDLIGLLNGDGIFPQLYPGCIAYINIEGNECFIEGIAIDDSQMGTTGYSTISSWDLLLIPGADQEHCCGMHQLTYTIACFEGDTPFVETGNLFIDLVCGSGDCATLDFSDPQYQNSTNCIDVCENSTMNAYAPSYAGSGFNYDWTIQGGAVVSGAGTSEVVIAWGVFGAGNIEVEITNSDPSFSSIFYEICVDIHEGPEAMFTSSGSACLGAPISFTNSSSANSTDFMWDFGDGTTSQLENPTNTYTSPGTYDVILTVSTPILDNEGNVICICSDSYTDVVTVGNLLGPEIFWISTLCEQDTSTYWTDADCGDFIWTVEDATGAPVAFTGQGTSEIFVQWGIGPYGTITLSVDNCTPQHCTEPTQVQVPIIPENGSIDGATQVCEGAVVTYDITKWNGAEYNWSVTGGNIIQDEAQTLTVQWGSTGTASIDITYSSEFLQCLPEHSADDCVGSAHLDVFILPEYDLTHNGSSNIACVGSSTIATASGTSGTNFIWSVVPVVPFTTIAGNQIEVVWPAGTQQYTITATPGNIGDYCNFTESIFISVEDVPVPTSISGPIVVCAGNPSYIYEAAPLQGHTVIWNPLAANPGGGLPTLMPFDGLFTEVTWGQGGPFTLQAAYAMTSAPYCYSDWLNLAIDEITIDPSTYIISNGAPCANTTSSFSISTLHPDAVISWSIVPAQYGSISSGQGSSSVDIQWNDIPGTTASAQVVATISLCEFDTDFTLSTQINKSADPIVVATDFCPGTSGTVSVTNASQFSSFSWSPTGQTTSSISVGVAADYTVNTIDINGCTSSGGATVNLLPAPSINLSTTNGSVLSNGNPSSTSIVTPFNSSYSYSWTLNGVTQSSTAATITHNWVGGTLPQTYLYTVTANEGGCISSESLAITETSGGGNPCPNPPCCEPEPYSLNAIANQNIPNCSTWGFSTSGSSNVTVTGWNSGGGQSSVNSTPSFTYSDIGYYTAMVSGNVPSTNNMGDCPVIAYVDVEVPLIADFSAIIDCDTPGNSPQVCLNDLTTSLPGVSITSSGYNMNGPQGYADPLCLIAPPNSTPTIDLTVTTSTGCVSTHSESITVPGNVSINLISPLCIGESGSFSASCPDAINFDWNFLDQALGTPNVNALFNGANANHSYTQLGTPSGPYVLPISVTATLANGCVFEAFAPLVIYDIPEPSQIYSVDGDYKFCLGGPPEILQLNPAAPSGTTVQWWQGNSSNIISGGASLQVSTSGVYGATFIDNGSGCETVLESVEVSAWPALPNGISGPSIICEGECIDLLGPSGNFTYQWTNSSMVVLSTGRSLNLCSYSFNGTDDFTLEIEDIYSGCSASSIHTVTIKSVPVINAGTWPMIPCEGSATTLLVDPVDPDLTYTWSGGNANPYTTYASGLYTVTGVSNTTGCSATSTVTVFPCPNLCSVPTGCYTACDSGKTICGPTGLSSYQWNFNYAPITGETNPCFTATQDGIYTLTATNSDNCPKTSDILDLEFVDCDSCFFTASDIESINLQSLGISLLADGTGCCMYSVDPSVNLNAGTSLNNLCMDIAWGDGTQDLAMPLGTAVDHCYTGECTDYNVSVKIFCCNDPSLSVGISGVATCDCIPQCFVRNSFHESISAIPGQDVCELKITSHQFLGPDMVTHQNPVYTITGTSNSGIPLNSTIPGLYDFSFSLLEGTYDVCYTLEGVSTLGAVCEFTHCHQVVVDCCHETNTISECGLDEEDLAGMELIPLGESDNDFGEICCNYGLSPSLAPGATVDMFDLCVDIIWGDGDALYNIDFANGYTHCYTPGSYTVTLIVRCCSDDTIEFTFTETITCGDVIACEIPEINFTWLTAFSNFYCPDGCSIVFNSLPLPQDICLLWDFGDGSQYNGGANENPIHCYAQSGVYPVCLTAYCCDESIFNSDPVSICHTVEVDCLDFLSSCPGDFDGDLFVGVNDLLEVLSSFGEYCPE
jgi:PKD repeat protein